MYDLTGKVALVTGSSMGLGKAFAMDLAKAGASLIVNGRQRSEAAKRVVDEIAAMGRKALLVPCDTGDASSVEAMVKEISDRMGRLDILVNNAAISVDATTLKYDIGAWERVLKTNLNGVFYCCKYCLPLMLERRWGRIINISSVVGQIGMAGTPAYAASKSALMGLTKTIAKEMAKKGITVNSLALGYFKGGGLLDTVPENVAQNILSQIPIGRWGTTEDITGAINFLVSDSAAYITGQTLNINGGFFM
jgi:3-oxoacyl-[acyl-carrier protein] reductase